MDAAIEAQTKPYALCIVKAWGDPAFRQKLLDDPAATLKANGVELPPNTSVSIAVGAQHFHWDNAAKTLTLPLPNRPSGLDDGELKSASLADVSVGACCCCCCT